MSSKPVRFKRCVCRSWGGVSQRFPTVKIHAMRGHAGHLFQARMCRGTSIYPVILANAGIHFA